ncbi:MAG: clan AA aspartic protease [Chthoniobacterales bacterium]|nr:clan AA aspartic protease [Chthoniobacterales bacterium]
MTTSRGLALLAAVSLTTIAHAQVMARRPYAPPTAPSTPAPDPGVAKGTGTPAGDAAAALAAGDLVRADLLYRADYQMGDRTAATLAARARLALWQNKLIEAENLARDIDVQAPEAKIALQVLATVASRRDKEMADNYHKERGATATIGFLKSEPLPAVLAMVNSHAAGLIIDSGSDETVISDSFARLLGVRMTKSAKAPLTTDKSRNVAPQTLVDHIDLGKIRVSSVPVTVSAPKHFATLTPPADGIMGMRFLARFRATIDYPHAQLLLESRNTPFHPSASAVAVPLWLIADNDFYVEGAIGNAEPRMWRVDTGLAGVGVRLWHDRDLQKAVGTPAYTPQGAQIIRSDRKAGSVGFKLAELKIGEAEAFDVPAELAKTTPASVTALPFKVGGVLGHEFFKRWSVTFDLDKMHLVLTQP